MANAHMELGRNTRRNTHIIEFCVSVSVDRRSLPRSTILPCCPEAALLKQNITFARRRMLAIWSSRKSAELRRCIQIWLPPVHQRC